MKERKESSEYIKGAAGGSNENLHLAIALKQQPEKLEEDIGRFSRLAKYYYGTEQESDFSQYTGEEAVVGDDAHLYMLIKYLGKEVLIKIGAGSFNAEVFTRRDIQQLKGFSHSPLPLFVVSAWADQEQKEHSPKIFLNEHTMIYSPKGGHAQLRTSSKQREIPINYGDSNGIMAYDDAMIALMNAELHKQYPNEHMLKELSDRMKKIKSYDTQQLRNRITMKETFISNNPEDKHLLAYKKIRDVLKHISDDDQEALHALVQSFNCSRQMFEKYE